MPSPGYSRTEQYTYDEKGNILSVSDGTYTTTYEYDSAGQLFRENNQAGGFTHQWIYDDAGNILRREEYPYTTGTLGTPANTVHYGYTDSDWGDLLTSYNGQTITSDEIGNMLSDGTWAYTWRHGRQLATMSDGSTTWNYAYDADGLRTMRTNGTDTYTYVYNGGQLSQMTRGTDMLRFSYDASGLPLTVTWNGTTYYYVTNIQGDVIGILNAGGQMVTAYSYDAWGNTFSVTGSMAGTLGQINPLRYRGYVYDHETGLYYLQSRYYNPELGRFISADGLVATGQGLLGNNMFAYCGNNPVNRIDPTGQLWGEIIVVITTIIYVLQTVETYFKLKAMGFQNVSFDSAHDCLITMNTNGIDTAEEKAHFFAQCYVESKLSLLEAGWLSEDAAEAYRKERPYYPYYGAGYIQLTWDYNYKAFSEYIGDPLIYDIGPKYVAENYAWSAAGWFWTQNRINDIIANDGSVAAVTRKVNGGYNKLQERTNAYNRFIIIWGG